MLNNFQIDQETLISMDITYPMYDNDKKVLKSTHRFYDLIKSPPPQLR